MGRLMRATSLALLNLSIQKTLEEIETLQNGSKAQIAAQQRLQLLQALQPTKVKTNGRLYSSNTKSTDRRNRSSTSSQQDSSSEVQETNFYDDLGRKRGW